MLKGIFESTKQFCIWSVLSLQIVAQATEVSSTAGLPPWLVSCFRAFVAGGLGFSGLNRGLFAQMVPRSRESEFFGLWMVAIKAVSWTVPLLMTALHQISGSFRFAITASLVFYIPALALASNARAASPSDSAPSARAEALRLGDQESAVSVSSSV